MFDGVLKLSLLHENYWNFQKEYHFRKTAHLEVINSTGGKEY